MTGTNFSGIPNSALSNSSITFGLTAAALGTTVNALTLTGNISAGNVSGSHYDNGNRVVSTSASGGNLTIVNAGINLTLTGPGASTVGSSTAIPVITPDAYGRISTLTTAAVVAPAGTLSGATLNATVTASSLTSVGTLSALVVTGATTVGNIATVTTTASTSNVTGAVVITGAGGVGVGGSMYVGNRVGYVWGANNASAVYQVFNPVTNSIDTIFG